MTACESGAIAAHFANLPQLHALLTAGPGEAPTVAHTLLRAQVVVEELFANSIHHGYGGEDRGAVWLMVERLPNTLVITYADAAPPYDPLADLSARPPLAAQRVGGLGRHLVTELPDRARYRHHAGRNEVRCEFDWRA